MEDIMEKKLDKRGELLHTLALLVCAAIWGSAFVAQSVGAEYVGAFTFLAVRNWIAVVFLIPVIYVRDTILRKRGRPSVRPANRTQRRCLLTGGAACGFFLCAASAFQQVGIRYTTTAKAGFITALYVVIVPILSVFFGKSVKSRIWMCVALAVLGLYLLCMRGELSLSFGRACVCVPFCVPDHDGRLLRSAGGHGQAFSDAVPCHSAAVHGLHAPF